MDGLSVAEPPWGVCLTWTRPFDADSVESVFIHCNGVQGFTFFNLFSEENVIWDRHSGLSFRVKRKTFKGHFFGGKFEVNKNRNFPSVRYINLKFFEGGLHNNLLKIIRIFA
jgi:hypothetical protein